MRYFVFKVLIKISYIFTEQMLTLQSWDEQITRISSNENYNSVQIYISLKTESNGHNSTDTSNLGCHRL